MATSYAPIYCDLCGVTLSTPGHDARQCRPRRLPESHRALLREAADALASAHDADPCQYPDTCIMKDLIRRLREATK